uniref:tRNA-splicing endonuclease subunit Sen15 domain-containing protein n=1 Tax=Oreochromis aureus TaxID=47969 RepID=A0A668S3C7_OREAU
AGVSLAALFGNEHVGSVRRRETPSSELDPAASRVRRWKEVSCVKSPELQVVLLEAREKEGAPTLTILPLPAHQSVTHKSIRHVLDRGFPMLLCAVAADSTLVYQRMTDGLVTPDPPVGPFQDVGRRQHRKRRQQR